MAIWPDLMSALPASLLAAARAEMRRCGLRLLLAANTLAALQTAIERDVRADAPALALAALLAGCAIGAAPRLRRAIAALAR